MGAWFRWLRDLWLGRRLLGQTTERATAVLTAATVPLFTISGGRIKVTQIIGEITTGMQVLLTNVRLQSNPTVGTTRNLCVNTNISGYAIGDLLGIDGINTSALLPPASSGVVEAQTMGVIVKAGTIDVISSAAPTGSIRWTLKWVPIDAGAAVVAA
ncbi:hypothetical protein KKF82_08790 [Patescibacteria group bacterium]|nr:hypothetical protein [Patescibacteria group bacterium]